MCSIIVLRRPGHAWPVLIAANRDEMLDRPWKPPGPHWPDRPGIVAGRDVLAGGSWLGINEFGVVAAALNRKGTLGPVSGKRSRGELVLDALDYPDAADAAEALGALDPAAYRTFNLVVADNRDAFLIMNRDASGQFPVAVEKLPDGLSMIAAGERDDPHSARIRHFRPRFLAASPPDSDAGDWSGWETLLAARDGETGSGPGGGLFIEPFLAGKTGTFGTVSSSLMALPAVERRESAAIWRFASGRPEDWRWENIALPTAARN